MMTADFTVKTTITHNDEEYEVEGVYIEGEPEIEIIKIEHNGQEVDANTYAQLELQALDAIEQAYWDEQ